MLINGGLKLLLLSSYDRINGRFAFLSLGEGFLSGRKQDASVLGVYVVLEASQSSQQVVSLAGSVLVVVLLLEVPQLKSDDGNCGRVEEGMEVGVLGVLTCKLSSAFDDSECE